MRDDQTAAELAKVIVAEDHPFVRSLHDTHKHGSRGSHDLLPPSDHPRSNHPPNQDAAHEPHDDVQRMPRKEEIPARQVIWVHLSPRSDRSWLDLGAFSLPSASRMRSLIVSWRFFISLRS